MVTAPGHGGAPSGTVDIPVPAVLLPTPRTGRVNVMTLSRQMIVAFEPPLVACVVSNANVSFAALRVVAFRPRRESLAQIGWRD